MKRFTVIFTTMDDTVEIGLIHEFSSDPKRKHWKGLVFMGWYAPTLKEAYKKYLHNKKGIWTDKDPVNGCGGWSDPRDYVTDMLYEITKKQLMSLIKMEELTGGL